MAEVLQVVIGLCALGGLLVSWWNTKKITEVHVLINSRLSELLELTKKASKAEGVLEGRAEKGAGDAA